jgi:hypothetical protein
VEDFDLPKLQQVLFHKHKIYTITVKVPEDVTAMRVTPSIYTTLRELDMFVEAVSHYVKNGLPG